MKRIAVSLTLNSRGYWVGHYRKDGKKKSASFGNSAKVSRRQATAKARQLEFELNEQAGDRDIQRVKLGEFREIYIGRRSAGSESVSRWHKSYRKLKPKTVAKQGMTLRYLVEHFGEKQWVDEIDQGSADVFLNDLHAGKLKDARSEKAHDVTISEQSMRSHIRELRAIFGWAVAHGYTRVNPFSNFIGESLPAEENTYVTIKTVERVMQACTRKEWQVFIALQRMAGMRYSEALWAIWSGRVKDKLGITRQVGVDWERRRICIVSNKTQMYREIPIAPRLHEILLDVFHCAPDGENRICAGMGSSNHARDFKVRIGWANAKPWPKPFQSLRSSCENDWKQQGIAEPTYTQWMGHSVAVSRSNYVAPTEAEFELVCRKTAVKTRKRQKD